MIGMRWRPRRAFPCQMVTSCFILSECTPPHPLPLPSPDMHATGSPQACHRRYAAVELDTTFLDEMFLNQRSHTLVEPKTFLRRVGENVGIVHILRLFASFSLPMRTSLRAADGWEQYLSYFVTALRTKTCTLGKCCSVYRAIVRPRFYEVLAWMILFAVDAA